MIQTAILAVLLPAILAGVLVLILSRRDDRGPGLGIALGLALGFAAGQVALVGWPGLLPVDATYRVFHLAFAGAVVGICEVLWKGKAPLLWALRAALAALVLGFLLRSVMEHTWEGNADVLWLSGLFVAVLVFAAPLEHLARTTRGFEAPLLLVLLISAGSAALVLGHSAFLGQLAGSLAAALGAVGVVALMRPSVRLAPGGVPVVTAVFSALVLCGYFFATLPATSAVLLALGPAAAALGGVGPLAKRPSWQVLVLRVVLLLVVAGVAVYLAYTGNAPSADEYDYSY